MDLINVLVQGIFLGSQFALVATGLSLIYGVMRIINLAHGDLAILGAYLTWQFTTWFDISPFLALVIVIPIMLAVGYALQRIVLARSLRGGELIPLLTTFGLAIVLQNGFQEVFSSDSRGIGASSTISTGSWTISSQLSIPYLGVLVLAVALAVLGGLQYVLSSTAFGREMRATAQDLDTAGLVGIPAAAVYARATAIATRHRRYRRHLHRDPEHVRPAHRADRPHLCIRGGHHRGSGVPVGHAVRRRDPRIAQTLGAPLLRPVVAGAHRPLRLPRLPDRSPRQAAPAVAHAPLSQEGRRMTTADSTVSTTAARHMVVRSTRASQISTVIAVVGALVLFSVPTVFTTGTVQKLTTLFIYVILAVMWNALAGYGGMVSVGQQAFIGFGAYGTVWLTQHGFTPFPAMMLGHGGLGGAVRLQLSP